jgi:uncharacterized protein YndB with AHSA1/START domain
MQRDIRHSWHFNHRPEAVWEYLTNSELLAHWLMENDFKLIVGHKFQFKTTPRIKLGFDGNVYCEVLEIIPLKRLSYSWKGGLSKDNITLDSIVIWTLTKTNTGTTLVLEHKGFKGMKNLVTYIIMNLGWLKIGNRILKRINASKNETTNA